MEKNRVYGLLGLSMKAGKLTFGTDATIDMINKNKIRLVILAEDISHRSLENFKRICEEKKVPIYTFGDKENLSKAIGKENKVVLGIRDKNLANAIRKILDGGDVIG